MIFPKRHSGRGWNSDYALWSLCGRFLRTDPVQVIEPSEPHRVVLLIKAQPLDHGHILKQAKPLQSGQQVCFCHNPHSVEPHRQLW